MLLVRRAHIICRTMSRAEGTRCFAFEVPRICRGNGMNATFETNCTSAQPTTLGLYCFTEANRGSITAMRQVVQECRKNRRLES